MDIQDVAIRSRQELPGTELSVRFGRGNLQVCILLYANAHNYIRSLNIECYYHFQVGAHGDIETMFTEPEPAVENNQN